MECNKSYILFANEWIRRNCNGTPPSRRYINRLIQKFKKTGSIKNIPPPGRPKSQRCTENIIAVAQHFALNPSASPKRYSDETEICSASTVRRILKLDIGWKPFKPKLIHKLDPLDFELRYYFCGRMLKAIGKDPDILSRMIFFDEVYIKLNGHVCTHNLNYWTDVQPNMTVERKSNSHGLMILIGISTRGSLAYFFDTEDIPLKYLKETKKCPAKLYQIYNYFSPIFCYLKLCLFLMALLFTESKA